MGSKRSRLHKGKRRKKKAERSIKKCVAVDKTEYMITATGQRFPKPPEGPNYLEKIRCRDYVAMGLLSALLAAPAGGLIQRLYNNEVVDLQSKLITYYRENSYEDVKKTTVTFYQDSYEGMSNTLQSYKNSIEDFFSDKSSVHAAQKPHSQ